jgi:hypothetical protein
MRWCFWMQMEDLGRMEARAVHVLDRLQATIVALSSARIDGSIFLSGVMEAEEKEAIRIEALWRKIEGDLLCESGAGDVCYAMCDGAVSHSLRDERQG